VSSRYCASPFAAGLAAQDKVVALKKHSRQKESALRSCGVCLRYLEIARAFLNALTDFLGGREIG
jgi:hypothetical protein